jgi:hypothetical protein
MKPSDYAQESPTGGPVSTIATLSNQESMVGRMNRYFYEGVYKITVPIEVTAYSQEDALERILRRDLSVMGYDSTHTDYDIVFIRCVEE